MSNDYMGGFVMSPEETMNANYSNTEFDPIYFLKNQINELKLQLTAEREYSGRLMIAITHLKEACGVGKSMLYAAMREAADNQSYVDSDALETSFDNIQSLVAKVDELLFPIAKEEKK